MGVAKTEASWRLTSWIGRIFRYTLTVLNAELFRLFFEESSDALLAIDLHKGSIIGANKSFSMLTGFESEELFGESINILMSSLSPQDLRERQLNTEILGHPGFYNDIYLRSKDGELRLLSVKVRHVTVENKTLALAVLSDDTERQLLMRDLLAKHQSMESAFIELERVHAQLKLSQEKIAQAAKLGALGEMAAGLSHEINQPLTGIKGFAQEILDILKDPKPSKKIVRELCQDIVSNADKMASLLSHFRSFARSEKQNFEQKGQEKLEEVDLTQSIDQVSRLLSRRLSNQGIDLCVNFDKKKNWQVLGLAHPIEQVLINLITNSRDALLDRKKSDATFQGKIEVQLQLEKEHVLLRVKDNGLGIDLKIQNKVFDPFFTTKDPGEGTGLGLSISYSIAHRFDGELILESSSKHGTTFLLKLKKASIADMKRSAA